MWNLLRLMCAQPEPPAAHSGRLAQLPGLQLLHRRLQAAGRQHAAAAGQLHQHRPASPGARHRDDPPGHHQARAHYNHMSLVIRLLGHYVCTH
jgi:hypothetical protein